MTAAYIYTLLRLPWLAPDITTAIVNGPPTATTQCQDVDAQGLAAPDRLGRAAPVARILKNFRRGRDDLRTLVRTMSSSHASLLPRLQQKSKPRNGAREIFVVTRGETTRALRLCRELDSRARQKYAQTNDGLQTLCRAAEEIFLMSWERTQSLEPDAFFARGALHTQILVRGIFVASQIRQVRSS